MQQQLLPHKQAADLTKVKVKTKKVWSKWIGNLVNAQSGGAAVGSAQSDAGGSTIQIIVHSHRTNIRI